MVQSVLPSVKSEQVKSSADHMLHVSVLCHEASVLIAQLTMVTKTMVTHTHK